LCEVVRVMSGAPQESVLDPLLFLVCVNDIWRNLESAIKLFAEDCIIYRKIMNVGNTDTLQIGLDRLGEWTVENAMKIYLGESKTVSFMSAWVKDPLNYTFWGPKNSGSKQLHIFRNNLT